MALCEMTAGDAHLVLAPSLGGAVTRLDWRNRPVLRPWSEDASDLFTLASIVLVPFSNRISGGGFDWAGTRLAVAPNVATDPSPVHGDGFQRVWEAAFDDGAAVLTLDAGAIGPWRYRARQVFDLTDTGLRITLTMWNTGTLALPFGGGFHPWFPRSAQTRLSFAADGLWRVDARHLPIGHEALRDAPALDFAKSRALPSGLINNAFTGWTGPAVIGQGTDAVSCTVTASERVNTAIVYSPGADAPFFCFEPVSHPVDAVNLPGAPGLRQLGAGESLSMTMHIGWGDEALHVR